MRLVERTLDDTPAIAPVSSATSSESEKEKKKSGGGIKSFFGFKKKDKDKEEKDKFVGGLVLDRPGCDILVFCRTLVPVSKYFCTSKLLRYMQMLLLA